MDLLETNHQGNASVFRSRCLFIGRLEKCGRFPKDRQKVVRFGVLEKNEERCSYRCLVNGFIICIYYSRSLWIFLFVPEEITSSNDNNMQVITLFLVSLQIKFPSLSAVRGGIRQCFKWKNLVLLPLVCILWRVYMKTMVQKFGRISYFNIFQNVIHPFNAKLNF